MSSGKINNIVGDWHLNGTLISRTAAQLNSVVAPTATNDSAAAGAVGEYLETAISSSATVSLVTATSKTVTSQSFTAGDWDIWGSVVFIPDVATTQTTPTAGIHTTTHTLPSATAGNTAYSSLPITLITGSSTYLTVGPIRVSLASTTTLYLVANITFAVSTMAAYGFIGGRRRR